MPAASAAWLRVSLNLKWLHGWAKGRTKAKSYSSGVRTQQTISLSTSLRAVLVVSVVCRA